MKDAPSLNLPVCAERKKPSARSPKQDNSWQNGDRRSWRTMGGRHSRQYGGACHIQVDSSSCT
jgi:hypothetical protein